MARFIISTTTISAEENSHETLAIVQAKTFDNQLAHQAFLIFMRRWLQLAGKHSTRRKHFCSSGCSSGGFETLHEIQSHWVQNHKTPAIKSKCHEIKLKTFSRDFVFSSMGSARLLREIRTDGVRTNNFLAETDTIFWRRIIHVTISWVQFFHTFVMQIVNRSDVVIEEHLHVWNSIVARDFILHSDCFSIKRERETFKSSKNRDHQTWNQSTRNAFLMARLKFTISESVCKLSFVMHELEQGGKERSSMIRVKHKNRK